MLSGGQRQRVAIGRAIVREPKIFLFDEPLSNLDAALRAEMRIELSKLHAQLKATMIYVTHDQVEAMTMADRIVVLNAGDIAQVGAPLELYHKPRNLFVAGFIGNPKMNFLPVVCTSAGEEGVTVEFAGQSMLVSVKPRQYIVGKAMTLGIRPEHMHLGEGNINVLVTPAVIERLGINTIAYANLSTGEPFSALLPGSTPVEAGRELKVGIKAEDCHLFDADGWSLERRVDLTELGMPSLNPEV